MRPQQRHPSFRSGGVCRGVRPRHHDPDPWVGYAAPAQAATFRARSSREPSQRAGEPRRGPTSAPVRVCPVQWRGARWRGPPCLGHTFYIRRPRQHVWIEACPAPFARDVHPLRGYAVQLACGSELRWTGWRTRYALPEMREVAWWAAAGGHHAACAGMQCTQCACKGLTLPPQKGCRALKERAQQVFKVVYA